MDYALTARWPIPVALSAIVTTRCGGMSLGPSLSTWNLAQHVGDDSKSVSRNRVLLKRRFQLVEEPVWLNQVHGNHIVGPDFTIEPAAGADGVFFTERSKVKSAAVMSADCLSIIIAHPSGKETCILHGGWRGLAANIIDKGLARFSCPASELVAWLGPCISPKLFVVGESVKKAFLQQDAKYASYFWGHRFELDKYHCHLMGIAYHQLSSKGIRHIGGIGLTQRLHPKKLFSYRQDATCGRIAVIVKSIHLS